MLDETESSTDTEHTAEASSWEERQLCPDGNCLGVIGPEGRCKVCGLAASPGEHGGVAPSGGYEGREGSAMASDEAGAKGATSDAALDERDDLADRRLCPDGNCLGLLGEDNRCKICGQVGD
jgi:hypothetical protein